MSLVCSCESAVKSFNNKLMMTEFNPAVVRIWNALHFITICERIVWYYPLKIATWKKQKWKNFGRRFYTTILQSWVQTESEGIKNSKVSTLMPHDQIFCISELFVLSHLLVSLHFCCSHDWQSRDPPSRQNTRPWMIIDQTCSAASLLTEKQQGFMSLWLHNLTLRSLR